jgi:hypothetical protein
MQGLGADANQQISLISRPAQGLQIGIMGQDMVGQIRFLFFGQNLLDKFCVSLRFFTGEEKNICTRD